MQAVGRNITLDYFKIVLALLVITIHMSPYPFVGGHTFLSSSVWLLSNGLSRLAVPCFFIINGYFLFGKIGSLKSVWKYAKRLLILYIVWNIIYFPESCWYWLRWDSLIYVLGFGYHHLWYIWGLLIATIIFYILKRYIENSTYLLILALFLFLVGYIVQWIIFETYGDQKWKYLSRNAFFLGFPFLYLGYYIRETQNKLNVIKPVYFWLVVIVGVLILILEAYFSYKIKFTQDVFLSLIILCPALFILILSNSKYIIDNDGIDVGQLATAIYLIHPYIIDFIYTGIMFRLHFFHMLYYPVVVLFSMIAAAGLVSVNKKIKIFL